jgi:hypothetical protein
MASGGGTDLFFPRIGPSDKIDWRGRRIIVTHYAEDRTAPLRSSGHCDVGGSSFLGVATFAW